MPECDCECKTKGEMSPERTICYMRNMLDYGATEIRLGKYNPSVVLSWRQWADTAITLIFEDAENKADNITDLALWFTLRQELEFYRDHLDRILETCPWD